MPLLSELLLCCNVERTGVSLPLSSLLVLRLEWNFRIVKPLHDLNSELRLIVHCLYIAHLRDVLLVETTTIRHAGMNLAVKNEYVIISDNLRGKLE